MMQEEVSVPSMLHTPHLPFVECCPSPCRVPGDRGYQLTAMDIAMWGAWLRHKQKR